MAKREASLRRQIAEAVGVNAAAAAFLKVLGIPSSVVIGFVSTGTNRVAFIVGLLLAVPTAWGAYTFARKSHVSDLGGSNAGEGAVIAVFGLSMLAVVSFVAASLVAVVVEGFRHGWFDSGTAAALGRVALTTVVAWLGAPLGGWLGYRAGWRW